MNRCSFVRSLCWVYLVCKCIRINFENKIWKSNNKTQNMKNIELYMIYRKRTANNINNSTQKIYEILLLANFFVAACVCARFFFSLCCYLEYIILNWRLLLFLSKLVMMLILVLVLLFLLIDPLYMNLSSKHSIKNMKRSVNFMLT